jgi:uncharacterized protein Yka (UPF0111/DUF47 family)
VDALTMAAACTRHFTRLQAALDALHEYYARSEATANAHSDEVSCLRARITDLETRADSAERCE